MAEGAVPPEVMMDDGQAPAAPAGLAVPPPEAAAATDGPVAPAAEGGAGFDMNAAAAGGAPAEVPPVGEG